MRTFLFRHKWNDYYSRVDIESSNSGFASISRCRSEDFPSARWNLLPQFKNQDATFFLYMWLDKKMWAIDIEYVLRSSTRRVWFSTKIQHENISSHESAPVIDFQRFVVWKNYGAIIRNLNWANFNYGAIIIDPKIDLNMCRARCFAQIAKERQIAKCQYQPPNLLSWKEWYKEVFHLMLNLLLN